MTSCRTAPADCAIWRASAWCYKLEITSKLGPDAHQAATSAPNRGKITPGKYPRGCAAFCNIIPSSLVKSSDLVRSWASLKGAFILVVVES